MLYTDLLRVTVLLAAGMATALAAVSLIGIDRTGGTGDLIVAGAWWTLAGALGTALGSRPQAGYSSQLERLLAEARTQTALPEATPGQVTRGRLWPLAALGLLTGAVGFLLPQAPIAGAGFALLWSLSWRRREAAVAAIEDRDGVRFYVEPTPAWRPVKLVRTPFMGGEAHAVRQSATP